MGRRSTPTALAAATLLLLAGCSPAGPEFLPLPSGEPVPTPTGEFGGTGSSGTDERGPLRPAAEPDTVISGLSAKSSGAIL